MTFKRNRILSAFFMSSMAFGSLIIPASVQANSDIAAQSFSGAYLAGRIAEADDHKDIAIDYFKQALKFDPDNVSMQRDMMATLLATGNFQQAVKFATKLKNDTDTERYVRLILAADAINKKSYNTARKLMHYSYPSDMDVVASKIISAWALYGRGDKSGAMSEIKNLKGPEWYNLFLNYHLALMNDAANHNKEAEHFYQIAYTDQRGGSAAPDTYERIVTAYASFLQRQNRNDEAIKILTEASADLSGRDALLNMLQRAQKGQIIEQVVKTPQDGAAEINYNLGTAINRGGAEVYARLYLQIALAMRPNHDATLYQLADIAAKMDNHKSAIALYRKLPEKSPYYRDSELHLALSLADSEQTDEAISHLVALNKEFPDDQRISMALSSLYMNEKKFDKAADVMNSAISYIKAPKKLDWMLFYQRGIAFERLKIWDKAEPDFRKALVLAPDQPQVLNYLGYSLIDRNDKLDEALAMVKKAVELRPTDGYIVDSLGWAYYKLGRYEEAAEELENAVKLRPQDPTINDHLGDAYWHVGRKLEATFQWQHAIDSKPEADALPKIEEKLKKGLHDS